MDLLTWIKTPDPSVEIMFDTELGTRLRQIFNANSDYTLLFSNPDFVSLLTQYTFKKFHKLNVPPTILISEKFKFENLELLERNGINHRFTANSLMHCDVASLTPKWLIEKDVFKTVVSPNIVRPDWSLEIDPVIYNKSKFVTYRSLAQRSMLRAAERLDPGDTLFSILPTSAGKSLLTHAAFMDHQFEGGLTICVVPTIALAIDQERQLKEFCQKNNVYISQRVFAWRSALSDPIKNAIKKAVSNGNQGVLFASPEALTSSLLSSLMRCAENGFLKNFIVDEAHLIVQWGDEFRPAFQTISGMRSALLENCPNGKKFKTHLLTATLSATSYEVLRLLFPGEQQTHLVNARLLRHEPTYHFKKLRSKEEKYEKFKQLLYTVPRPAIIYTTEKLHSAELYNLIINLGFERVACFTGDTPDEERQEILTQWKHGELDLVVATSAFGVGIDNNSVRSVVHVGLPETLDRYYQEAGRAGRDGRASISIILYDETDISTASNMAVPSYLTEKNAFERWRTMNQRGHNVGNNEFLLDTGLVPSNLQQDTEYNRNWNLRTLTMMSRAGLIKLSSIEPKVVGLNATEKLNEEQINEDARWAKFFRTQKVKLLDPQVNNQEHFDQKIARSRDESIKMHIRQFQLFNDYLNLEADLGDCLARLYSFAPEGAAIDVLPTCRGCEYCKGEQNRVNEFQHMAPRIRFKEYALSSNLDPVLDLKDDPIIFSTDKLGSEQITDLIEKLSNLFPIIEVTSDATWITETFWDEIYPKLRKKSVFITEIENLLAYGQTVNVPLAFVCTSKISEKQFSEFLTLEKDVALFIMLEDRRHPFLGYRSFIENTGNKVDYGNFITRLSI
jgi:ATP-dependent DNA helicase RecQ